MDSNLEENDKIKKDICSSPYTKPIKDRDEPSEEEVQNEIDKINSTYDNRDLVDGLDKESAINVNEILMNINLKNKNKGYSTTINEIKLEEKIKITTKETNTSSVLSTFEVINQDPYLKPFENKIKQRVEQFNKVLSDITTNEGGILEFSRSYLKMGLYVSDNAIIYKEYAPGAKDITIVILNFNNSLAILIIGIEMNFIVREMILDFGPFLYLTKRENLLLNTVAI